MPRKHPERTAHVRVKYRDEYENIWDTSRALFPKPPEERTLSNGERSRGTRLQGQARRQVLKYMGGKENP